MIVAIGLDVDEPFTRFVEGAVGAEVPLQLVNLRAAVEGDWRFQVPARGPAVLVQDGQSIELKPDDSYFCRLIDLSSQTADAQKSRRWQSLLGGLRAWLTDIPGPVVNRGLAGAHNSSKPLHETILQELGFRVPESITACDVGDLARCRREVRRRDGVEGRLRDPCANHRDYRGRSRRVCRGKRADPSPAHGNRRRCPGSCRRQRYRRSAPLL